MATKAPARADILRMLFGLLYRSRTLYWLASTIPFAGQWRVWQRLVIPRILGRDVLEIGCGIGTLLTDMVKAGYRCAAVDRSPQMVAATRDRLRSKGVSAFTPVLEASAQKLPFAAASFDTVVSTFPTEYVQDPATLREVGRVLRPGGRYIVVLSASFLRNARLLTPLAWVQDAVYGRNATPNEKACMISNTLVTAIPFEAGGLNGKVECVRGPFWEAYLLLGEKPREAITPLPALEPR
jgi:SAM-dependent methyltransferase